MEKIAEWPHTGFFQSVFKIKCGKSIGTAFFLDHKKKSYLISAKHIFPDKKSGDSISLQILKDGKWIVYRGVVFFHSIPEIDISVILPQDQDLMNSPYNLLELETPLGSEGFFLGFPYNYLSHDKGNINDGFPFPLIKKAVSSGVYHEENYHIVILDGHNNPGFSGGPVIFKNRIKEHGEVEWRLDSVISAYVSQNNKIITPSGDLEYHENSGLIIAYPKIYLKEIIENIPS